MKITVDREKCIGCSTCVNLCGDCFELIDGKSRVKDNVDKCESCDLDEVATACPVGAITLEK
ncbi:MAG: ferredoxin [Candidatus Berkelbacteria bacterium]|nr:ferredoxin [Candidatus Berkelbacteria bacterium]